MMGTQGTNLMGRIIYFHFRGKPGKKITDHKHYQFLSSKLYEICIFRQQTWRVEASYTKRINLTDTDTWTLCNNAEGNLEHILLHCPHIQTHRLRYNIQSLEHLWTRPVEVYNFLHDAGVLQSTHTSPPHTQ